MPINSIYIMASPRHPFRYKIGVAKNTGKRRANIDKTVKGSVIVVFSIPILYAYKVESILHGLYRPLSAKMHGSGKTEWFWFLFPVTPVLLLILTFTIQVSVFIGAIALLLKIGAGAY